MDEIEINCQTSEDGSDVTVLNVRPNGAIYDVKAALKAQSTHWLGDVDVKAVKLYQLKNVKYTDKKVSHPTKSFLK